MDKKRAKFEINGLVQGVGFRYFVLKNAEALGLNGYAKNKYDGSVEVVAEGGEAAIDNLHGRLRQGPGRANVEKCLREDENYTGEFQGFNIR
ncbi:MAG: acylphosphatase [Candidatus Kapaibacterium sp.]